MLSHLVPTAKCEPHTATSRILFEKKYQTFASRSKRIRWYFLRKNPSVTLECFNIRRLSKNAGRWQKLGQIFPRLSLPKQRLLMPRRLMPPPKKGQRGGNTSGNFLWLWPGGGPRSLLSKGPGQAREVPRMPFLGEKEKVFFWKML